MSGCYISSSITWQPETEQEDSTEKSKAILNPDKLAWLSFSIEGVWRQVEAANINKDGLLLRLWGDMYMVG